MKKYLIVMTVVLAVAGAAAMILVQGDLFAQDGPWGGGRPGGQRPDMGRMPRIGGGAAMISAGNYIFVYNGQTLFKVNPASMQVEKTLELKSPEGAGGPGGQGEGPGGEGPGGGR